MQNSSTINISPDELLYFDLREKGIVFNSKKMRDVFIISKKIAETECTVLVLGESGVGKEVVAKVIHDYSLVHKGAFVKINCGAIPETLLESELFGYTAGAFTGAKKEGKAGKFEEANNGTLLLDEIGDLPLSLQVKLLHFLEEKEVIRIGSNKSKKVNTRIIAATNKDLESLVKIGKFRKDLYYRLNVVPIYIPPLRERKEDIMPLIINFKRKLEAKYHVKRNCSSQVAKLFSTYDWPGNVRELKNLVERIFLLSETDNVITPEVLLNNFFNFTPGLQNDESVVILKMGTLKNIREEVEKQLIKLTMEKAKSMQEIANLLNVDKATISRKIKKYHLTDRELFLK